jgi:hypothetical protein
VRTLFEQWWDDNCDHKPIFDYGYETIGQDIAFHAFKAALQSQSPEEWKLVPVEPTNAMVEAAELDACGRLLADDIADAYSAMLAAAKEYAELLIVALEEIADDSAHAAAQDALALPKPWDAIRKSEG